jgi:hypothetical protein
MPKNLRWLLLFILFTFPCVGFSLSKLAFKNIPPLHFEQHSCQTCCTPFLEDMIVKHHLYLSKLAAQMVTSENLVYQRYGFQNQNFDFKTTKTLILHAWSIFFNWAHLTKLWNKKIFSMKTMSKLGALPVLFCTKTVSLVTDMYL